MNNRSTELAFSNPMEMPKIIERNLPYLDDTFFNCLSPDPRIPPAPKSRTLFTRLWPLSYPARYTLYTMP